MNQEKNKNELSKAGDEQNFLNEEKETPNQKFQRIANDKCSSIGKNILWLLHAPKQPSYDVSQKDAQKIIDFFEQYNKLIRQRYSAIAEGKKINKIEKPSIQDKLLRSDE